jgi:hypothetical protein
MTAKLDVINAEGMDVFEDEMIHYLSAVQPYIFSYKTL